MEKDIYVRKSLECWHVFYEYQEFRIDNRIAFKIVFKEIIAGLVFI